MKSGKRDYFYFDFEKQYERVDPTKTKSVWLYLFIVLNATFNKYFSYIMATSFRGGRSWEYPERTTDHGQATGNLYHLRLRVECTLCCNLQSKARTHTVLVICLYELLGNSTTYPTEPPGPSKSVWCGLKCNIRV